MKQIVIAFLLCFCISLTADAHNLLKPQTWENFEPVWMENFARDTVQVIDKGKRKIYILEQGIMANFYLDDANNVEGIDVHYIHGTPSRYIKGVRQTIKTIFGKEKKIQSLINEFTKVEPERFSLHENGVCLERLKDPQLGLLFYATYSEECPKYTK